ncbi:hypothetical protein ABZ897_09475 [Nonomuraea sp. NPDC046802]|uniref:hypothetical protein n=1 Tax=Nonomuraea sp. NPDC046802 TaxID=3154919 RepID=UPI0033DA502F
MRKICAGLAAALILTGCAEEPSATSPLLEAMGEVAAEGPAAAYFEYGEPTSWRALGVTIGSGEQPASGTDRGRRWLPAIGSGSGELTRAGVELPQATGVDPYAADRAIAVGVPPNLAFRFDGGFEAKTVRAKLERLGAKPRRIGDHNGLSFAPGADVDLANLPVPVSGVTNQFNQVVVTDATVATAPVPEPITAVLGGERSLAERPEHAAVAECLGDVAAATITAPQAPDAVALYAVGLRRPANLQEQPVNVICVLPVPSAVPAVKKTFTTGLTPAATSRDGKRFGELAREITHDEVRSGEHTVLRATLKLTDTSHVLLAAQMLQRGELQFLADPTRPADPSDLLTAVPTPGSS